MPIVSAKRFVALALLAGVAVAGIRAAEPRLRAARVESERVTPPAPILEYVTFGHRRGVSAALWLQLLTWYGGKTMGASRARLDTREDVAFLQKQSRLIIRMDPDFPDPYYFAAILLTWYAGEPGAALPFVEAGMNQFPTVWEFPFYYGFIQYRFLHDKKVAARFFLRAGTLPNVPPFVPLLGAKLLREEDGTADTIETLEELLRQELPERVKVSIEEEITTLRAIAGAEAARSQFRRRHGRDGSLDELVRDGFLRETPVDAMGVPLYLDADGRVAARSGGLH